MNITQDYLEESAGKYNVGISAIVRVTLKDGTYHEDVGWGSADIKGKGAAIEKAKKVTFFLGVCAHACILLGSCVGCSEAGSSLVWKLFRQLRLRQNLY